MKRFILLLSGTLVLAMLSGCGCNTIQANGEAVIARLQQMHQ